MQHPADQYGLLWFCDRLRIQTADGLLPYSSSWHPFQRERFEALGPALESCAKGEVPATSRFWLESTKGADKTSGIAAALLWFLTICRRPFLAQVAAKDREQAAEVRKAMQTWAYTNPWLVTPPKSDGDAKAKAVKQIIDIQVDAIVNPSTGGRVELVPCDVAGAHGSRPDVLVLDEVHAIEKWELLENLLDNASKVGHSVVIAATNAGFLGSKCWDMRELARTSPRWFFHKYDKPAPWLSDEEIDEAKVRNGANRFRRLWCGEWVHGTECGLEHADVMALVTQPGPHECRESNVTYFGSLDVGVRRDWSAFVTLGVDIDRETVQVADVQTWSPQQFGGRVNLESVQRGIETTAGRYGFRDVLFDPKEAEQMSQALSRRGFNMIRWSSAMGMQDRMATVLLEAVHDRKLELYPHDLLIADLLKLQIKERSTGYRIEHVRDEYGHGDRAAALVAALPLAFDVLRREIALRDSPWRDGICDPMQFVREIAVA